MLFFDIITHISNYVSSTDNKGYKKVIRLISEGITNANHPACVIHGRTVNWTGKEVIVASLTGVISEVDIVLIGKYLEEIELFRRYNQGCQEKLTQMRQNEFPKKFENLQTIPEVKDSFTTCILAEIGADMKMFITVSALVSWCGLKSHNEERAGKI